MVLVVGGLFVGPSFIDWTKYKDQIIAQIEKETNFQIEIKGNLDIAVLPSPQLVIEGLSIKYPENYGNDKPVITLEKTSLHAELMPLFKGKVIINNVTLVEPDIRVDINKQGDVVLVKSILDVLKERKNSQEEQSSKNKSDDTSNAIKNAISLNKINIKNGSVHYVNNKDGNDIKISDINLEVRRKLLMVSLLLMEVFFIIISSTLI